MPVNAHAAGVAYVRRFLETHGHSNLPSPCFHDTVADFDVYAWWATTRAQFDRLPDRKRADVEALGALGADLRPQSVIKAEQAATRRRASLKRQSAPAATSSPFSHSRRKAVPVATPAAGPDLRQTRWRNRNRGVLAALTAFAAARRHTLVPLAEKAADGTPYGLAVDRWREAHARGDLPKHAVQALEEIDYWTWHRTPAPQPRVSSQRRPAVIPSDTTQMKRLGLRQFLPDA